MSVSFVDAGVLPPGVLFARGDNLPDLGRWVLRLLVALAVGVVSAFLGPVPAVLFPLVLLTTWACVAWVDRWWRGTTAATTSVVLPRNWRTKTSHHLDVPSDGAGIGAWSGLPPSGAWGFETTVVTSLLRRGGSWGQSPIPAHPGLSAARRHAWSAEAAAVVGEAARFQWARNNGRPPLGDGSALLARTYDLMRIWDTGDGADRLAWSRHLPAKHPAGRWAPGALVAAAVVAVIVLVGVVVTSGGEPTPAATTGEVPVEAPTVQAATVTRIVDGDTIDVSVDGVVRRVRLLNVDTPETVKPGLPVECLGPEATQALRDLLPIGTVVDLEYDAERQDRYGRDLAAVRVDGRMVSEELARQGLGVAVLVGENDRFYDQVVAAQAEAQAAGRGLFSDSIECTVPAQIMAAEAAMQAAASAAPTEASSLADVDAFAATVLGVAAQAEALDALLQAGSVLPLPAVDAGTAAEMLGRAAAVGQWAQQAQADVVIVRTAVETRLAAEEETRRAAEAAAAQARESPRPAPSTGSSPRGGSSGGGSSVPAPAPAPEPAPPPPSSGSSSSGGGSYTGCRAYGPNGTSVDSQGRPYTKIDCDTGLPIG